MCDFDSSPQFTDKENSWFDRQASHTFCRNSLPANRKTYSTIIDNHTGKAIALADQKRSSRFAPFYGTSLQESNRYLY